MWDLATIKHLNNRQKKTGKAAKGVCAPDRDPGPRRGFVVGDLVKFRYNPCGTATGADHGGDDLGFVLQVNKHGEVLTVNTALGTATPLTPDERKTVRKVTVS